MVISNAHPFNFPHKLYSLCTQHEHQLEHNFDGGCIHFSVLYHIFHYWEFWWKINCAHFSGKWYFKWENSHCHYSVYRVYAHNTSNNELCVVFVFIFSCIRIIDPIITVCVCLYRVSLMLFCMAAVLNFQLIIRSI